MSQNNSFQDNFDICFVTANAGKLEEAKLFFGKFNIKSQKLDLQESQSFSQEEIVLAKARQAYEILGCPVVVDDTGIYFEDFNSFPGTFTKYVFKALGHNGIIKLLEGTSRKAFFRTLLCYTDGNKTKIFEGVLHGTISSTVSSKINPSLPLNSIFIPEGSNRPLSELSEKEAQKFSHRAKALERLSRYLLNGDKNG